MPAPRPASDLLQGTLDVLLLKTLSWGPLHGYGVARWVAQATDADLQVEDQMLVHAVVIVEVVRVVLVGPDGFAGIRVSGTAVEP